MSEQVFERRVAKLLEPLLNLSDEFTDCGVERYTSIVRETGGNAPRDCPVPGLAASSEYRWNESSGRGLSARPPKAHNKQGV